MDPAQHPRKKPERRDRQIEDTRHDPYRSTRKLPDFTLCRDCGLVYRDGRWQRLSEPWALDTAVCPACARTQDRYPAGYLRLSGSFFSEHREEIQQLLANTERRESEEHPLQRVMDRVEEDDGALLITTTGTHLASALATALHRAYGGTMNLRYADQENLVRAAWFR